MRGNMKNKIKSVCEIAGVLCMLALFSCLKSTMVYATASATEENAEAAPEAVFQAAVVSSRTTDSEVYIYIKGVSDIGSGTTVQVGNALCQDIQAADVVSTGMPIKTTILFDNSKSISKNWGSQAVELARGLIDNHAAGEEFRIVTFADGVNVVADFSTEYESLKGTMDGIEFFDQKSYLTDILYDLLNQSGSSDDASYMRFVIITDGADDNEIKYTQTELADIMKSSGVVIHTVGVKASNNNSLLENLFSYARLTGGTYTIAEKNTDVKDIRNMIDEDYSLLCLKLVPSADIMDGSRKEAKLNLNTSNGAVILTASLQMPFADVSSTGQLESAEMDDTAASVRDSASETKKPELPSITVEEQAENENSEPEKSSILPATLISAAVLAVIVAVVVLFILKGKKKKTVNVVIASVGQSEKKEPEPKNNVSKTEEQTAAKKQSPWRKAGGNTVKLGGQSNAGTAGRTMRLNGGIDQNVVRQSYISLTDLNDPQKSFRVPIDTRIVIGREEGDILLGYNAAVSYKHCEIIKKGNLFYVNDLKSSNGTFYGGMRVHNETPIMNSGILEVGKCKYKITIEN